MIYIVVNLKSGESFSYGDVQSAISHASHILSGAEPVHMYPIKRAA